MQPDQQKKPPFLSPAELAQAQMLARLERDVHNLKLGGGTRTGFGTDEMAVNSSGQGTITFGQEFPTAPTVLVSVGGATARTAQVVSVTTVDAKVAVFADTTPVTSTTVTIHWQAAAS